MNNGIKEIADKIFARTNGGLAIILSLYPQANTRGHFKLRDERTPSCNLHKLADGNYVITDFGGNGTSKNAIHLYAEENGLSYAEAVLQLAPNYQIETGYNKEKNEAKFRTLDLSEWDNTKEFDSSNFYYETKDFTEQELKTLGPFVTAKTCGKYSLYSLKFYAVKKERSGDFFGKAKSRKILLVDYRSWSLNIIAVKPTRRLAMKMEKRRSKRLLK